MKVFLEEILEHDELKTILRSEASAYSEAKQIAAAIMEGKSVPTPAPGLMQLYVLAYLTDYALEKNAARGINRAITIETLKDVNVWVENYQTQFGKLGLGEFGWLILHYTGDLFKLGRLQFRIGKPLAGIPFGDTVIETHIQQGAPLKNDACLASFEMAKDFFLKYFPEEKPAYFMCDSWLLNPNLADVLDETSNIVRFMRLWTPIPFPSDDSAQAIERVFGFGVKKEDLATVSEHTSLQKKLKSYLLAGGSLNITAGYRKI